MEGKSNPSPTPPVNTTFVETMVNNGANPVQPTSSRPVAPTGIGGSGAKASGGDTDKTK